MSDTGSHPWSLSWLERTKKVAVSLLHTAYQLYSYSIHKFVINMTNLAEAAPNNHEWTMNKWPKLAQKAQAPMLNIGYEEQFANNDINHDYWWLMSVRYSCNACTSWLLDHWSEGYGHNPPTWINITNCTFDFLSPILISKGGILSAWSFPWGRLCPGGILSGGIMSGGDYVRGGFCPTPLIWI